MGNSADKVSHNLVEALQRRSPREVQQCLNEGANVNCRNWGDQTPLHVAAARGHLDVVRMLLDRGAVSCKDRYELTPLHRAAYGGHVQAIYLLLDHGANVNCNDCYGLTPLHRAAYGGHLQVVHLLLDHGANVKCKDCSHDAECAMKLIDCPVCGIKNIKRQQMNDHLGQCPEVIIKCSYNSEGCTEEIKRQDINTHNAQFQSRHFHLTSEAMKDVRDEVKLLKGQLKEAQDVINQLMDELDKLRKT